LQIVDTYRSVFVAKTRHWSWWLPAAWHFLCIVKLEPRGVCSVCSVLLRAIDLCVPLSCFIVNAGQR
jgi:hypothetical protein